jgi:hypothetical protein
MTQRLHSLLRQVGLEIPADLPDADVSSVSCDSRRIGPGTLFIGLPGSRVDGGSYWPEVLAAGAVAAVIGPRRPAPAAPGGACRRGRCGGGGGSGGPLGRAPGGGVLGAAQPASGPDRGHRHQRQDHHHPS